MNPFIKNVPCQIQRKSPQLVGATVMVLIWPELMENERFSHHGSKAVFFILLSKNRILFNRKIFFLNKFYNLLNFTMITFEMYPVYQKCASLNPTVCSSAFQIILGRFKWPITHWDMEFLLSGILSEEIVEPPVYTIVLHWPCRIQNHPLGMNVLLEAAGKDDNTLFYRSLHLRAVAVMRQRTSNGSL